VPVHDEYGSSEFLSDIGKLKGAIIGTAQFGPSNVVSWYIDHELFSNVLRDTQEVIPIYKEKQ
jgi:hypothetical protein